MSLSAKTKLYAIVGDPVGHSLSPLIHNRWIAEAGLDAAYVGLHLQSPNATEDLRALARAGYSGLSVTLPHKIAALASAATSSPAAKRIGAANCLVRESGLSWVAHNTDIDGFREAFSHAMQDRKPSRVVLIGAGGAARAAALVLSDLGVGLAIVNRSKANAMQLASELAPGAEAADLAQLTSLAETADIVINSASLGHAGASLPALPAGKGRPFFDMTYGKAAAPSLEAARAAGWVPHDGLRMLVGQARAAFKLWFNITPDTAGALKACEAEVARPKAAGQ